MIHTIIKQREIREKQEIENARGIERKKLEEKIKLKEDLDFEIFSSHQNSGSQIAKITKCKNNYKSLNKEISKISLDVDYVLICDSGIEPVKEWDSRIIKVLNKEKSKNVILCPKSITPDQLTVYAGITTPDPEKNPQNYFYGFNQVDDSRRIREGELSYFSDDCFFTTLELLKENPFDESFTSYFADYKLSEIIKKKRGKILFIPEPFFYFYYSKNIGEFNPEIYDSDGKIYMKEEIEMKKTPVRRRGRPIKVKEK